MNTTHINEIVLSRQFYKINIEKVRCSHHNLASMQPYLPANKFDIIYETVLQKMFNDIQNMKLLISQ